MPKKVLTYAPDVWKCLNGFFSIYKPPGSKLKDIDHSLRTRLCRDLNKLNPRPPRDYVKIGPITGPDDPVPLKVVQNYADHPLVIGPRYQNKDIDLVEINKLEENTSGVYAFAIGEGCQKAEAYAACNFLSTYHITGQLGLGCLNYFHTSNVLHKAKFSHVTPAKLERQITMLQNSWQTLALKYCGVDLSTPAAYEMASKGLVRPADPKVGMMVYNIKLIDFKLPYFTLEVQCSQGNDKRLMQMVCDVGLSLKTVAAVTKVRVLKFGHFTLDRALLQDQWNLQDILDSIHSCRPFEDACPQTPFLIQEQSQNSTDSPVLEQGEQTFEMNPEDIRPIKSSLSKSQSPTINMPFF